MYFKYQEYLIHYILCQTIKFLCTKFFANDLLKNKNALIFVIYHYVDCILTEFFFFNRCEALNFELSKSQKKIIKKVTKFLKSGECETNAFDNEQAEREPLINYESHGNLYI